LSTSIFVLHWDRGLQRRCAPAAAGDSVILFRFGPARGSGRSRAPPDRAGPAPWFPFSAPRRRSGGNCRRRHLRQNFPLLWEKPPLLTLVPPWPPRLPLSRSMRWRVTVVWVNMSSSACIQMPLDAI